MAHMSHSRCNHLRINQFIDKVYLRGHVEPINGQLTLKKLFYALTSSRQFQLILQETATPGMVKLLKVNL